MYHLISSSLSSSLPSLFLKKILFIYLFLERGREGKEKETNIDVREIHRLVASRTGPDWVPILQFRHVP